MVISFQPRITPITLASAGARYSAGLPKRSGEIDTVLAGHYGFTAEELDFILNYDIKYRLGRSPGEEED